MSQARKFIEEGAWNFQSESWEDFLKREAPNLVTWQEIPGCEYWIIFSFEDGSVVASMWYSSGGMPKYWTFHRSVQGALNAHGPLELKTPSAERGILDYVFRIGRRLAPNGKLVEEKLGRKLKEGETVALEDILIMAGMSAVVRILRYAPVTNEEKSVAGRISRALVEALAESQGTEGRTAQPEGWFDPFGVTVDKIRGMKKSGLKVVKLAKWPLVHADQLIEETGKPLPDFAVVIRSIRTSLRE